MYDVIIPARNEQSTIAKVIRAAKRARGINKVIVVDDHSTDSTALIARAAGATVIKSRGRNDKAKALATGVARSKAKILVFCDADIGNVQPRHIEALVHPVQQGYAMCCGLVDYKKVKSAIFLRLPPITGMRAIRRELFQLIPKRRLSRYNIELNINAVVIKQKRRCAIRVLKGMTHRTKFAKLGYIKGLFGNLAMTRQLIAGYALSLLRYPSYRKLLDILPPAGQAI